MNSLSRRKKLKAWVARGIANDYLSTRKFSSRRIQVLSP
jgi:hypothetical protein